MSLGRPSVAATLAALALLATTLGACRDPLRVPAQRQFRYGIIAVPVSPAGDEPPTATPLGSFFRSTGLILPTSDVTQDSCIVQDIFIPNTTIPELLSAGDSVNVTVAGGSSLAIKPVPDTLPNYRPPVGASLSVSPGANITFDIPGAPLGFPPASITAKTAEPFTMTPLPTTLSTTQDLELQWTPAGDAHSKMVVLLQYGSPGFSQPNRQIFCVLIDDGRFEVPRNLTSQWRTATPSSRATLATRWRTKLQTVEQDAVLLVVSTFDYTGTFTP